MWESGAAAQGLDLNLLTLLKAASLATAYERPTSTCTSVIKPRPEETKSYNQALSVVTPPPSQ